MQGEAAKDQEAAAVRHYYNAQKGRAEKLNITPTHVQGKSGKMQFNGGWGKIKSQSFNYRGMAASTEAAE